MTDQDPPMAVLGDEEAAQRAAAALVRWSIPFRYEYVGHVFTLVPADGDDAPDEMTERQFRMLVETA